MQQLFSARYHYNRARTLQYQSQHDRVNESLTFWGEIGHKQLATWLLGYEYRFVL